MQRSEFSRKSALALAAAIVAATASLAGPLEPPPGPVTSTGRFGPRIDVATLPTDATAVRVISQPGSYYLSGDLTGVSAKAGIRVAANGVTLDLNGYSLIGVPGSLYGIVAPDVHYFTILSGNIRSWGADGIHAINGSNHVLRNIESSQNGGWGIKLIQGGIPTDRVTIVECMANNNGAGGITAGDWVLITRTTATSNTGDGIRLSTSSSILDSLVSDNSGTGIACAFSCLVRGNFVDLNTVNVDAPGSTVIENHP